MPEIVNGITVPTEDDPVDLPGNLRTFAEDVGTVAEEAGATAGAAAAEVVALAPVDAQMATVAANPASEFAAVQLASYAPIDRSMGPLLARLADDQDDASILVCSDSTGAATGNWPELLVAWLHTTFPTYSVVQHKWSNDTNAYTSPVTLHTGTGSNTLHLWQGAAPGQAFIYILNYLDVIDPSTNPDYDLIAINLGHNMGPADTQYDVLRDQHALLCSLLRARRPMSAMLTMSQNPREDEGSLPGISGFRSRYIAASAAALGIGYIDIYRTFIDTGNWEDYILPDGIHPTVSGTYNGSALWANELIRHARTALLSPTAGVIQPPSPLHVPGENLLGAAGNFWEHTEPGVNPDGWARGGGGTPGVVIDIDNDHYETGTSSLRLTGTGVGAGVLYTDTHLNLEELKGNGGEWVTIMARVYIPSSVTGFAALVALDDGVHQESGRGDAGRRDKWCWITCSKRWSPEATRARALIYSDASVSTDTVSIDRIIVVRGILPRDGIPVSAASAADDPAQVANDAKKAALLATATVTGQPVVKNWHANPGAEQNLHPINTMTTGGASTVRSQDWAETGDWSYKYVCAASVGNANWMTATTYMIPCAPGDLVTVSAVFRNAAAGSRQFRVGLRWMDNATTDPIGGSTLFGTPTSIAAGASQRLSYSPSAAPSGTTRAALTVSRYNVGAAGSDVFYVDDLIFEKAASLSLTPPANPEGAPNYAYEGTVGTSATIGVEPA